MMHQEYTVIIEKSSNGWGAYLPDMPGCIAVGDTPDGTLKQFEGALKQHLAVLRERGEDLPQPGDAHDVEINNHYA